MSGKRFIFLVLFLAVSVNSGTRIAAQDDSSDIHVFVDMVQLNLAVTDNKGNYITGLNPQDFAVTEDNIPQKIATFGEGNESARRLDAYQGPGRSEPSTPGTAPSSADNPSAAAAAAAAAAPDSSQNLASLVAGANVFILFDTSNYMYRGFVFAQDAISDFVRSLEGADKIAFYSYSRDLYRGSPLTADRSQILRAVRTTVAGDDAALYNTLLLTLKDAARITGRKVVVVFSNGPDNSSVIPPEDVAELAQSMGISVYMISTRQAKLEPVSTAVFERMTAATGGKAYFAKAWNDERRAFASIRDDLKHLYSISYYPQANPNRGWRNIKVRLVGERLKKYHIRTRDGYRPQPARFSTVSASASGSESGSMDEKR
jgi:VWFA-related protein